ncbi:MAG TPA: SCP2 sterol-binding domain-containing protein [Myxococcota bacterium]|nr:SCP2 sterol-binding domain-containing protein [Myxococcota bacterium]HRY94394.1 SCP2 sterol-binding domain-containing protein [Myxococcota bacterium]HSA19992.1 SCP2 sterol-binding domain-containing protein [Myxococcota bacterium]
MGIEPAPVPFASQAWVDALQARAEADGELLESLARFEGPLTVEVRPEPGRLPGGLSLWVDAGAGRVRAMRILARPDERPARFVVSAAYGVWEDIVRRRKGLFKALLLGRLTVRGDKAVLLRHARTAACLARILADIPTRFD